MTLVYHLSWGYTYDNTAARETKAPSGTFANDPPGDAGDSNQTKMRGLGI